MLALLARVTICSPSLSSQIYTLLFSSFLVEGKKRVVLSCCCFSNWWCCQTINLHKRKCSDLCALSKTTNTHSYKSYITSAYWAQFKVHNRNMKRGGKVVKQVVRKPAITNPVGPQWAVFYILMGFVARYSLRYFNQYETKCISANLLAFLSRISKHYLHGSIIKMCIS